MADTPPRPAAGWYPAPGGGKRFWDGYEWSSDVIGAPSREAEYAAIDPYLPAPATQVIPIVPQAPARPLGPQYQPAGWYPGPTGALQWWDGRQWGPFAPPTPMKPLKEVGIAYLFLLLLGGFAAHRFYVGRVGSAVVFLCLWWGGWLLTPIIVGIPLVFAAVIWWIVDLFILPSLVRDANAQTAAPTPIRPL